MIKSEAFIAPGEGASDALIDWLELHEVLARVRDVRSDESALAEAVALGGGRLPVYRRGDEAIAGYDPAALQALISRRAPVEGGLAVVPDEMGRLTVAEVVAGSPGADLGLRPGDVIVRLSGYSVFSADQLNSALRARRTKIVLGVRRGEDEFELALPAADRAA